MTYKCNSCGSQFSGWTPQDPPFPEDGWLTELCAALGWQGGTIHDALKEVRRLAAKEPVAQTREALVWLIESKDYKGDSQWWGGMRHWTEALRAVWFSRKQDAEMVLLTLQSKYGEKYPGFDDAFVTEHEFVAASPPQQAAPATALSQRAPKDAPRPADNDAQPCPTCGVDLAPCQRAATYAAKNPLGGPATMFETIASRLRAGEEFDAVMRDYGIRFEKPND